MATTMSPTKWAGLDKPARPNCRINRDASAFQRHGDDNATVSLRTDWRHGSDASGAPRPQLMVQIDGKYFGVTPATGLQLFRSRSGA